MSTTASPSTILSARDLQFMLFEWLDVEQLVERPRFAEHDRETYDALLALCEQLATEHFAPHYRRSDTEEPVFDGEKVRLIPEIATALEAFAKADLLTLTLDEEVGGQQVPHVVASACMAWFTAANIGTAAYSFLTVANAGLLLAHGTPEQVERFVTPMLEGRFFGTMTLSEPHAGSSLGDVVTRAVPADDGTYRIFGSKMWISGGDHEMGDNIVHLVLAKLPDAAPGTRGISLFVVPKHLVGEDGSIGERNDVALAGINHKLGSRGTVNTAPVFGSGAFTPGGAAGAVGHLVGEPGKGLSYMFHMMNAARLGVGMSATTTAYTAYLKSLEYARSRPQGRRLGAADPSAPQVPIIEHADVRRMLLAQKSYVEGALALNLYCSRLLDVQATARDEERAHRDRAAARPADADREVLAVAVGAGEQQPGDPGARRLGLHPRLRRRGALARPAAEPHPRGHPRHPGARPPRSQGPRRRWRLAHGAGRPDRRDRRPGPRPRRGARRPRRRAPVGGRPAGRGDARAGRAR